MRSPSGWADGHGARGRAGGDQHDVGVEQSPRRRRRRPSTSTRRRGASTARSRGRPAPRRLPGGADVAGLRGGEREDAAVDRGRGRRATEAGLAALVVTPHAPRRRLELGHEVGRRDERLARHAVGEHRGAADAVAVDDGHRGAEVGGDERGLVAPGAAAEDDDGLWRSLTRAIQPPVLPRTYPWPGVHAPCLLFVRNREAHSPPHGCRRATLRRTTTGTT